METQSLKKVFYSDDDFTIEVEEYHEILLLHCEVSHWSHSVLRRGITKFLELEKYAQSLGYAHMGTVSPNIPFVRLFGGNQIGELKHDGKYYGIVLWDLKPQH